MRKLGEGEEGEESEREGGPSEGKGVRYMETKVGEREREKQGESKREIVLEKKQEKCGGDNENKMCANTHA